MNRLWSFVWLGPLCIAQAMAWQPPAGAGHWEGAIKSAGRDIAITVDLAPGDKGVWTGAMSMPAQGAHDIPLTGIAIEGDAVRFRMFDGAESPVFEGKIARGGAAIAGHVAGSGESANFELKRTGDASLRAPEASTALSDDFVGVWQGILTNGDRELRLEMHLARAADGTGSGTVTSVALIASPRIPITTITQKAGRLEFSIRSIGGSYSGALDASRDAITGTWTQAGATTPLVFHRVGAPIEP